MEGFQNTMKKKLSFAPIKVKTETLAGTIMNLAWLLSETLKFIMYPDVTSFDKLNLSQFDWLEIEEFEMQLIDFQSSSMRIQKFIETRKELELIETERLTSNISKNANNKILETWNSLPDTFNCLKKLARAILTIFSSTIDHLPASHYFQR
ncbi:hypothetical protein AVEN_86443-1 [Araneus ventricosus]|uniref:Uncharacterized protein n=1 Tax=Araneus ventricosus TaxID=182803 RepID=A0A4Y2MZZ4_ARAVE|nr:hypothetical protein AVEN_86443-1 [Araneus ventricosus]